MNDIRIGQTVRYHGSITQAHGTYTVDDVCWCTDCTIAANRALRVDALPRSWRYVLVDDWGEIVVSHVRGGSISPLLGTG